MNIPLFLCPKRSIVNCLPITHAFAFDALFRELMDSLLLLVLNVEIDVLIVVDLAAAAAPEEKEEGGGGGGGGRGGRRSIIWFCCCRILVGIITAV